MNIFYPFRIEKARHSLHNAHPRIDTISSMHFHCDVSAFFAFMWPTMFNFSRPLPPDWLSLQSKAVAYLIMMWCGSCIISQIHMLIKYYV